MKSPEWQESSPDASRTPRRDTPIDKRQSSLAKVLGIPLAAADSGGIGGCRRNRRVRGACSWRELHTPRPRSAARRHPPYLRARPRRAGRSQVAGVCTLEHAERNNVYCSSACCVSTLLAQGWRLSDPGQLAALVKELSTGRATSTRPVGSLHMSNRARPDSRRRLFTPHASDPSRLRLLSDLPVGGWARPR